MGHLGKHGWVRPKDLFLYGMNLRFHSWSKRYLMGKLDIPGGVLLLPLVPTSGCSWCLSSRFTTLYQTSLLHFVCSWARDTQEIVGMVHFTQRGFRHNVFLWPPNILSQFQCSEQVVYFWRMTLDVWKVWPAHETDWVQPGSESWEYWPLVFVHSSFQWIWMILQRQHWCSLTSVLTWLL